VKVFIGVKLPSAVKKQLVDFQKEVIRASIKGSFTDPNESITLFWSPWGSKDSGCSKIKIAKVKACCYSTFTLAIYCFMDFATNVKKKKKKRPILLK
jgi:hypothetical protein